MSFQQVILHGRLGGDVEVAYTQSGTAVAKFSVATSEFRKDANGERVEETSWHRVSVWGKRAETCAKYLKKGSGVVIQGKLKYGSYENNQGVKVYTTDIVAFTVDFTDRPQGSDNQQSGFKPANNAPVADSGDSFEDLPF